MSVKMSWHIMHIMEEEGAIPSPVLGTAIVHYSNVKSFGTSGICVLAHTILGWFYDAVHGPDYAVLHTSHYMLTSLLQQNVIMHWTALCCDRLWDLLNVDYWYPYTLKYFKMHQLCY